MTAGILGLGSPLLDILVHTDQELLSKHCLNPDGWVLADDVEHSHLLAELQHKQKIQVPGGSAQNSMRVAQFWFGGEKNRTTSVGAVGIDSRAHFMLKVCAVENVKTLYQRVEDVETGTCTVLITDRTLSRSMVTRLGASMVFDASFLDQHADEIMRANNIFYNDGFFTKVSPEAIERLVRFAQATGGVYATNLSAESVVSDDRMRSVLMKNMPNTDILFGNESEFIALAKSLALSTSSLGDIAATIAEFPSERPESRSRTVVITRGSKTTLVAVTGLKSCIEVPIVEVASELIVDVNGAGDAYVGGFLAALSEKMGLLDCCRAGAECAALIIQQSGCSFPSSIRHRIT